MLTRDLKAGFLTDSVEEAVDLICRNKAHLIVVVEQQVIRVRLALCNDFSQKLLNCFGEWDISSSCICLGCIIKKWNRFLTE